MTNGLLDTMPLGALRAFDAVIRAGGVKLAAKRLGVTPTAVSHQLRTLEDHLGAKLFDRSNRRLHATRAGAELARATGAAFDGLEKALDGLIADGLVAGRASLTISAAPTFAAKWLAPRLHGFQSAHPNVALRLRAEELLTDPSADRQIDIAIRYGAGPFSSDLIAERLWPEGWIGPVAAPLVAAKISYAADLLTLTLLRTAAPPLPVGAAPIGWDAWFQANGVDEGCVTDKVARGPLFGTTQLALEAAMAGHGVALSPGILVEADLRAGRLVAPLGARLPDSFGYWLLVRRERVDEARIRAFSNWLRAAIASEET